MRDRLSKTVIKVFLSMLFLVPVWAESAEELFDPSVLHDIRLQLDPSDWEQLQSHYLEDTRYPAAFQWRNERVGDAKVRSRGSGSRNPQKPSLKIEFGRRFKGLKSLVLRNLLKDPSMMKDRLVLDISRAAGFPTPRSVHARVFVNERYLGLYELLEDVNDKAFLQSRFGEDGGTLFSYKWNEVYFFEWKGNDPAHYFPVPFRPHINKNPDPMGIVSLINAINNTSDGEFVSGLGQHLNLEAFIKYVAIDHLIDEWDGVTGEWGLNNFYLYQHQGTAFFTFIPWDKGTTFINWEDSIYKNWELSPLTRRIFTRPELWALFLSYLEEGVRNWVNPEWFVPRINFIHDQIREAVHEEAGTVNSFEEAVADMRRFAERRRSNVLQQIAGARGDDPERYKLYFPLFVLGANDVFGTGYATGLAVVNRTPGVASVRYKAYDGDGRLIAGPVEQMLRPAQQIARFEREVFWPGLSGPQIGWIEVSSNVDVKGFFITTDPQVSDFINGADVSSQLSKDLVFMHAEVNPARGVNTYYAICNPSDKATRVNATFSGLSEPPQDFVIPAKGLKVIRLNPSAHVDGGYMRLSSDEPITGIQLVGNTKSLTVLKPMTASNEARDLVFPHFVVNGGFTTKISVINTTPGRANLTITASDMKGDTMGERRRTLDPGQHLLASVGDMFGMGPGQGLMVGYVRVQSDIPGLVGFTEFDYGNGRAVASIPLATAPSMIITLSHVANNVPSGSGSLYYTGLALVNPNDYGTIYFLRLYDREGRVIAHGLGNTLNPFHKEALLISEFVEESLPSMAGGYIVIRSTSPLYGYEAFFTDRVDQLAIVPAQ